MKIVTIIQYFKLTFQRSFKINQQNNKNVKVNMQHKYNKYINKKQHFSVK